MGNSTALALLALGSVGSNGTARCGDAPSEPPRQAPKSPAAGPLRFFRKALRFCHEAGEQWFQFWAYIILIHVAQSTRGIP